jgi:hypothetical protein
MSFDPRRWRKRLLGDVTWRRLARSAIEIYACLQVWAIFFADRVIFQPPPPARGDAVASFRIPVAGGEKIAVYGCTNASSPFFVLHCHGNAEDLDSVRYFVDEICAEGFSAVSFDYRGYGASDGRPGSRRAYADGEAALKHLIGERGIPPGRIIVHGRSVGAAVAIRLASSHDVAGLVIESGFLTAFRVKTVIPLFLFDKMRNDRAISNVKCPVLVIHGEQDDVIPAWHGRKLFELVRSPKVAYWVSGAGHNDVLEAAGVEYWNRMRAFVSLIDKRGK